MIDIDEQPHTNQIYGVRTRLRDDGDRELERLPDAKRPCIWPWTRCSRRMKKRRVLDASVCGAVVEVLLVDDLTNCFVV